MTVRAVSLRSVRLLRVTLLRCLALGFSLASVQHAAAQSAAPAEGASAAPPASAAATPSAEPVAPLAVRIDLGARNLDAERVRSAIERELGQPVRRVEAGAALELALNAEGRLNARYTRPGGDALVREVELPADDARAVEVVALLAGNLTRDEAGELARALAAEASRRAAETVPPQPARVPEPAPAEPSWLDSPSANLSLFHPLSVVSHSEQHRLNLELGLAYSKIGALAGFGATFGVLQVEGSASGAALGMLWARVGRDTSGLSASLLYSDGRGDLEGASLSAVLAWQRGRVSGAQLAVGAALAGDVEGVQGSAGLSLAGSLQGMQGSVGVSIVKGDAEGMVGAAGLSIARDVTGFIGAAGLVLARDVTGAALAGGGNVTRDVEGVVMSAGVNVARDVSGLIATGGINVARDVDGVALAPVNVSRRVDGLQLGVVNVASEVHGAALGVVSIAGNGHVQPSFWASTELPLHVSVKFVAGYAYSELGMAMDRQEARPNDAWVLAFEAGAGAHIPLTSAVALEPGVHYSELYPSKNLNDSLERNLHYRLRLALRLMPVVEVFAGGGARHGLSGRTSADVAPEFLGGVSFF